MFGFRAKLKASEESLKRVSSEREQALNDLERVSAELQNIKGLLGQTDSERIAFAQQLNDALLELQPARFNSNHYKTLHAEHRIIELDFPIRPRRRDWADSPHIKRLQSEWVARSADWRDVLEDTKRYLGNLLQIPREGPPDGPEPYYLNGWIPGLDGALLYALVATHRPDVFFEVGSGNSTKFVRKAIQDHGLSTKIISVDPAPRAEIDAICDHVHRVGFEDFDLSKLDDLTSRDIVFIDNSHRSLPNSDVTVFFLEALGRLPKGILYGLHDIFLPFDYPEEWAPRYYSEQYLLASYLFGGADGDTVIFPAGFVSNQPDLISILDPLWKSPDHKDILPLGGAFWVRKG